MNNKVICFLFLMLIAIYPVFAARPLVTDDFGTIGIGIYEIEIGYYAKAPKNGGAEANSVASLFKRGFTSNFELGIEAPYSTTLPTGFRDAILHAKLKLVEQGKNDGLTTRLDVKFCNANSASGLGSGYNNYTATVIYSKAFGDLLTHYNLGYTLVGGAGGATNANTINYSAAIDKNAAKGIDVVAEYYVVSAAGGTTGNIQLGGYWQATKIVRLDAGYSIALNDNSSNIATAGLTAIF